MRSETLLTPLIVAQKNGFLDWDSQPSLFKRYPDFCYRIAIDSNPALSWVGELRCISDERSMGGKPYRRLNVPSAGNLHPIEIYLQIRNVTGVLSGIYHLDVVHNELVMIEEIGSEGMESMVGLEHRFNGFLLFMTIVPFRSSWKYGLRGWRYLYLDLGHQIGALHGVIRHFGHRLTKLSGLDTHTMNKVMGLGSDEFVAAVYAIGEMSQRPCAALRQPLMMVQPCDYTRHNIRLIDAIVCETPYSMVLEGIGALWDVRNNRSRRSAREFGYNPIDPALLDFIIAIKPPAGLEVIHFVREAHAMHYRVYQNGVWDQDTVNRAEIVHLLLEQRFIANANVVSLIFAENFDAGAHINAGIVGQELYAAAERHDAGCTGIGAFYDEEASRWNNKPLVYAVATGSKI